MADGDVTGLSDDECDVIIFSAWTSRYGVPTIMCATNLERDLVRAGWRAGRSFVGPEMPAEKPKAGE
jgi:hypothetical protein